ncbi:MAG: lipopolysaccharide transport periplasmic protein LptA [Pseudomonadota bacterium]
MTRLATTPRPLAFAALLGAGAALALAVTGIASAQEGSPFGGFKHDNTQPIEITSDALEVQQANNLAIFSGDVIAGQGTLRLNADRIEVYYDTEQSGGDTGAIQRLRADGNVLLSNGAETASGTWGEYDVNGGTVRMGGSVVLSQGDNAISGESLVINLNSGVGRIQGGRVRSVFTPSQSNGDAADQSTGN